MTAVTGEIGILAEKIPDLYTRQNIRLMIGQKAHPSLLGAKATHNYKMERTIMATGRTGMAS